MPRLLRPVKIRKWHCDLEWVAGTNESSYQIYKDDVFFGNSNTTFFQAINLDEDTNHVFKVRAVLNEGGFSSFTPDCHVRTGLYPIEETPKSVPYVYVPEPTHNNSNPYINLYGLSERRISNRVVSGDNLNLHGSYSKVSRMNILANGNAQYIKTQPTGLPSLFYDYNTYDLVPTVDSDLWVSPAPSDDYISYRAIGNKLYRSIDGTQSLIYTATGYIDSEAEGSGRNLLPTAESYPSFDGKYFALEAYKQGDTNTWCIVFDLTTDSVVSEVRLPSTIGAGVVNMSASGRFVTWHSTSSQGGTGVYYLVRNNDATQSDTNLGDFNLAGPENNVTSGHGDIVVTLQGNDGWFGRVGSKARLHIFEGPQAGKSIDLFPVTERNSEPGHCSGKNFQQKGWGYMDCAFVGELSDPQNGSLLPWYRNYMGVMLDEYAEDRNQDTLMRYYARSYWDGTTTANPSFDNIYPVPSPDGKKATFNSYLGTEKTSYVHGELYVAEQTIEHGDEIPLDTVVNSTVKLGVKKAFPTAQGHGRFAEGNLTDNVYVVNNLNESGSGSLASARQLSNVTIQFNLSGEISFDNTFQYFTGKNVTLAFETAPAPGIIMRRGAIFISGNEMIIRHMKGRRGYEPGMEAGSGTYMGPRKSINLRPVNSGGNMNNIIIDHLSLFWAHDETISIGDDVNLGLTAQNITMQNCIIAESLVGYGILVFEGPKTVSLIRNAYLNIRDRMAESTRGHDRPEWEQHNSLMYGYGRATIGSFGSTVVNMNNLYRRHDGRVPPISNMRYQVGTENPNEETLGRIWDEGNIQVGLPNPNGFTNTAWDTRKAATGGRVISSGYMPFPAEQVDDNLDDYGATAWGQTDPLDERVKNDYRNGTGNSGITRETQVGGFPTVVSQTHPNNYWAAGNRVSQAFKDEHGFTDDMEKPDFFTINGITFDNRTYENGTYVKNGITVNEYQGGVLVNPRQNNYTWWDIFRFELAKDFEPYKWPTSSIILPPSIISTIVPKKRSNMLIYINN